MPHAMSTEISPGVAANIDRVLSTIRSYLQMDIAFVSEFLGLERIFRSVNASYRNPPINAGDVLPLATGYCEHVVAGRLPELIPDTRAVPLAQAIPETTTLPIGAHLSVPIRVGDGRVFGTFCCLSHEPRPGLDDRHLELMRTFAQLVATELDGDIAADVEKRRKRGLVGEALAAGDPQIVFQPILRLSDLTLVGVEALSRFVSDPNRKPDLWFADAHDVGIGDQLELLAVRKALVDCSTLPAPLSVSVNLSPSTLVSPDLGSVFEGFDRRRIVIEITEHRPIENYEPILRALAPLRDSGIRVAIDDAGAGYSSLRHVLAMRPDIIKFDVSLTRDLDRDPMRKAMVAALSEFGKRTSTVIVAEGVETESELATLRELGVSNGQGYHLGRPQALPGLLLSAARHQLDDFVQGQCDETRRAGAGDGPRAA